MRSSLLLFAALLLAAAAPGQSPAVEVKTTREDGGHTYVLTVRNLSDQPIRRIEVPHFNVDQWQAPDGWTADGSNIAGKPGVGDNKGGILWAETDDPTRRIARGRNATFRMRVNNLGADRGTGSVVILFADQSRLTIDGVDLPRPRSAVSQVGTPLGLAALLALFVLWQVRRKRGAPADDSPAEPPAE